MLFGALLVFISTKLINVDIVEIEALLYVSLTIIVYFALNFYVGEWMLLKLHLREEEMRSKYEEAFENVKANVAVLKEQLIEQQTRYKLLKEEFSHERIR